MAQTRRNRRMRRSSTRKARAVKRAVRSLRPKTRTAVTAIAKRVANLGRETKYVADTIFSQPVPIYGDTVPTGTVQPQIYECLPDLSEGVAEYERDGVKIQPVKVVSELDLRFNNKTNDLSSASPLDTAAWDIDVHIWYGYVRRYKSYSDIIANASNILSNHLENGLGSTLRWGGGPYDHFNRVNKEWFNLKHKVVRMYRPLGQQNVATLAGGLTTYFPQDIHKVVRMSFKPPKTLLYNETNVVPENYAPVCIIGYQHRNGTQAANSTSDTTTLLGKPALMMNIKNHMYFKDA